MRSPDRHVARAGSFAVLLGKELRDLLAGRALWILVLLLCPVVGYGFLEAVGLYSEASRSAAQFPELARGLSPLDGILVPTFGAFYVAITLLFPFVAIRLIGAEKQSGGLKLLLQLPYRPAMLVAAKLVAAMAGWLLALVPVLSATALWAALGGHLSAPETLTLVLGHLLYGLLISAVGLLAAAITDNAATAAIIALAFTLGTWVFDFAAVGQGEWMRRLAALSPTAALKTFETGLISVPSTLGLLIAAAVGAALATVWLPLGTSLRAKLRRSTLISGLGVALGLLVAQARIYEDAAEDRRNSFAPADELSLRQLALPLTVTVYLAPDDPRFVDLNRNVLAKLQRVVPQLVVVRAEVSKGLFGPAGDDRYGLVVYQYGDRQDESRSTSPREILPLIYELAGITRVAHAEPPEYPGYPLTTDPRPAAIWFYAVLPALIALLWWQARRPRSTPKLLSGGLR